MHDAVRLGAVSPNEYFATLPSRSDEQLRGDLRAVEAYQSRLAAVRRRDPSVRTVGAGWSGASLLLAHGRISEAMSAGTGIVVRYEGGALRFSEGREGTGLPADVVRALWPKASALHFEGPARESAGQAIAPAGAPLHEWWGRGYGSPSLRRFLAPWADTEAAEDEVKHYAHAPLWADLDGLAVSIDDDGLEPDDADNRYAIIDTSDQPGGIVATFTADSLDEARRVAIAAVTRERHVVHLALYAGTATHEQLEGAPVYRGLVGLHLRQEARAAQSLMDRAVEARTQDPYSGHIIRAHEADDGAMVWDVQVIQAGLSANDSFWPRDVLRDHIVPGFEGAAVEEIFIDPQTLAHLPGDVLSAFPEGITGVVVGQLRNLRFDGEEGGNAPDSRRVRLIAEGRNMTTEQVIQQSVGRVIGELHFDDNNRGRDAHGMCASADSRGQLPDHPQLSIDSNEAPGVAIFDPETKGSIVYRTGISTAVRRTISMVNRGAAGGLFLSRKAA